MPARDFELVPALEAVKAAMTFDTERLGGSNRSVGRTVAICVGALLSLALHGSVLASFLYWAEQKPGAIEQPTEAISLEFFKSEVLETVKPSPSVVAASAAVSGSHERGHGEFGRATHRS